jgi:hypothetical protein
MSGKIWKEKMMEFENFGNDAALISNYARVLADYASRRFGQAEIGRQKGLSAQQVSALTCAAGFSYGSIEEPFDLQRAIRAGLAQPRTLAILRRVRTNEQNEN